MKISLLLFLQLLFSSFFCFAQQNTNFNYGLRFKSHLSNLDERTSLILNDKKSFNSLNEGFTISFDIKLRQEEQMFGYVFRMISDENSSFDFLTNLKDSEFNFIINNSQKQIVASKKYVDKDLIEADKWLSITLKFFKSRTDIQINKKSIVLDKGIESFKNIQFYFGANKNKLFHTTEVPPISVRNIKIIESERLLRNWTLAKHNDKYVYDEVENDAAVVDNGIWEIDSHTVWEKTFSLILDELPQITFDKRGGKIFVVVKDKVYSYATKFNSLDTIAVQRGNPYIGISRQLIFDDTSNELISYTNLSSEISKFSFVTNSWSSSPTKYVDSRQHHNHVFDSNAIYIINGYGYHQYNGDILKLDLNKGDREWSKINYSPAIFPRYLSAMSQDGPSEVLLLGGYGSKSGKQEEFPNNFYDLYRIDYTNGKSKKLWEMDLDTPLVFSNSMYIDHSKNKLFVLGHSNVNYKSNVSLYSFDIDKPVIQRYDSNIPFNFLDIESFCDLFFDEETSRLYAILSYKNQDDKYEVAVYQMGYPVLTVADVLQTAEGNHTMNYILISILLFVLFLVIIIWRFRVKKTLKTVGSSNRRPKIQVNKEDLAVTKIDYPVENGLRIQFIEDFSIINRDGENCTASFTPILKNIFICLLLHTFRNREKGISSFELDKAFWFGMSSDKALNNRSVNMRKLRVLLSSIGQIQIDHTNSQWLVKINEDFNCDYQELLNILQSITDDGDYAIHRIQRIIQLAKAKLLPSLESEWIDTIKTDFTTSIIKVLTHCLQLKKFENEPTLKLQIVDIILIHDSLDELAIVYKCNLLYKLGQKGQSKRVFDKYCLEYEQMLASKATLEYQEVIDMKI